MSRQGWNKGPMDREKIKRRILRGETTKKQYTHGMGGLPRTVTKAKPVTLPDTSKFK